MLVAVASDSVAVLVVRQSAQAMRPAVIAVFRNLRSLQFNGDMREGREVR